MIETAIKQINYQRPPLANYQLTAIFCPERYALIEASTKAGKTGACLVWLLEQALQGENRPEFMVDRAYGWNLLPRESSGKLDQPSKRTYLILSVRFRCSFHPAY